MRRKTIADSRDTDKLKAEIEANKRSEYTSIKMSLRRGMRHLNAPTGSIDLLNALSVKQQIDRVVIEMTKCMKLGSLSVHCCLMEKMCTGNAQQIRQFFNRPGMNKDSFTRYFRGVQHLHDAATRAKKNYILYDDENPNGSKFQRWCNTNGIRAPDVEGLGHIFDEASQLYYTCFRNNIWMYAKQRMRKFCYMVMQRPNKAEVERTLRHLFYSTGTAVQPNADIMQAFRNLLRTISYNATNNNNNYRGYFFGMSGHARWFKFVPLFLRIETQVWILIIFLSFFT